MRNIMLTGLVLATVAGASLCGACSKSSDNQSAENIAEADKRDRQMSKGLVRGDPKTLIIQSEQLPTNFAMAGGEPKGVNEYSQVYFNPQALVDPTKADPELLGVIANLTLLDTPAAAGKTFTDQGGLNVDSVINDIRAATPGAQPLGVEPYSAKISGTDRVLAFRVRYILNEAHVFEYRFRFRVANAVGNLIISALATAQGEEPAILLGQAQSIAELQAARLNSARR
jgi:hypothetical protein